MFMGIFYAAVAGAFWGLVFVGPLLLPDYPAAWLAVGRYLAFGLIALPLALFDQGELRRLQRADWIEALKLSAVGNFVYYLCLALGFQGRYRLSGAEVLPNVVRNLLKKIEGIKGAPSKAVSPSAYVHPGLQGRGKSGSGLVIASAIVLAVAALLYGVLMFASDGALDPARETIERLQSKVPTP